MSEWADNYDVNATSDTIDGSCQLFGCTDSVMFNYDSLLHKMMAHVIQLFLDV